MSGKKIAAACLSPWIALRIAELIVDLVVRWMVTREPPV